MPFDATIVLTGTFALVPETAHAPPRLVALAPDGYADTVKHPKNAQDGSALSRHYCFLRFPLSSLDGACIGQSTLEGLLPLQGQDVTLSVTGGSNDLTITNSNFSHIAPMNQLAPGYETLPMALLDPNPPEVATRIILTNGTLRHGVPYGNWVFPRTLSEKPLTQTLSAEAHITLTGIDDLTVHTRPFASETTTSLVFANSDGTPLQLVFGNLCDENPLRWKTVVERLPPDEDFKWHYQLLSFQQHGRLRDALLGLPLPIPHMTGSFNAEGVNCFPALFSAFGDV